MPRWIQYILFTLIFLLPWQSVLIIFLTSNLGFPTFIALWKEIFTAILCGYFLYKIVMHKQLPSWKNVCWYPVYGLAFLHLWIISVSAVGWGGLSDFIRGYRFELWWLIPLVLGYCYSSLYPDHLKSLRDRFQAVLEASFISVAGFALSLYVIGQERVLGLLGYGNTADGIDAVLCHSVDYGVEGCRAVGTFTSPNHFGIYLILMLPVLMVSKYRRYLLPLAVILTVATISRAALLALIVVGVVWVLTQWKPVFKKMYTPLMWSTLLIPLVLIFGLFLIPESALEENNLPSWLGKPSSSVWHSRRTKSALRIIVDAPFTGFGLGLVGPAASPVYADLDENDLARTYMHIVQFQPEEFVIPENWFLQTTIHGGILYTAIYIVVLILPIISITKGKRGIKPIFLAAYYGLLLSNLVLHTWENQTVALYTSYLLWWYESGS